MRKFLLAVVAAGSHQQALTEFRVSTGIDSLWTFAASRCQQTSSCEEEHSPKKVTYTRSTAESSNVPLKTSLDALPMWEHANGSVA